MEISIEETVQRTIRGRKLYLLISNGNASAIRGLLRPGIREQLLKEDVRKCIKCAINLGQITILTLLVEHGFEVQVDDLLLSLSLPSPIKDIVYNAVDLKETDSHGRTALHLAVEYDDVYGLRILLSRGADVHVKNTKRSNETALYLVRSPECAKLLLAAGAELQEIMGKNLPNTEAAFPATPLTAVALGFNDSLTKKAQTGILEIFIKYGADPLESFVVAKKIMENYGKTFNDFPGLKTILQLIATLDEVRRHSIEENFLPKVKGTDIERFYEKCRQELKEMERRNVFDNLTFLDFVTKFADGSMNQAVLDRCYEFLTEYRIRAAFPIYGEMIEFHFQVITDGRGSRSVSR